MKTKTLSYFLGKKSCFQILKIRLFFLQKNDSNTLFVSKLLIINKVLKKTLFSIHFITSTT
jgi:hypothetical protein